MAERIPVAKPWIGRPEAAAARRAILSGWVTQGPEVAAFEREFAAFVGARHACAVSSATTALHLSLLACGVKPGDEVITVSHSFIATANAVRYCGATPVFVDVEPGTFNIDPALVERAITRKTRAILCVHQMGMPCDLDALTRLARRRKIPLVEDAACASGSEIRWKGRLERVGRPRGLLACFSFHPRKLLTTGDGGMITTSDAALDRRLRLLRQHGMGVSDAARHKSRAVVFESYPVLGFNYRMTDIQAAIGREQLKRLPAAVARRRKQAALYKKLLGGVPRLGLPVEPSWARSNWQSFCVRLPKGVSQRRVMESLLAAGIATRRGIMCSHREAPYRALARRFRLPQSEAAQDRCLILPLYHQMSARDQEKVARALRRACA